MAISPDGMTIYAGATLDDDSKVLISAQTSDGRGEFKVLAVLSHQPNGLAADWDNGILYFTDEGNGLICF